MPTRKLQNHAIKIKKEFVPRKGRVYPLLREERGSMQVHSRIIEERVYQALEVASNSTSISYREEGWKEAYSTGLQVSK